MPYMSSTILCSLLYCLRLLSWVAAWSIRVMNPARSSERGSIVLMRSSKASPTRVASSLAATSSSAFMASSMDVTVECRSPRSVLAST